MGQMTYGVLYGVSLDVDGDFSSEDTLEAYAKTGKEPPEWEGQSTPCFLGYFIAAGASGKDGVPKLESFRLDSLDSDKRYAKATKLAAKRWAKFADWCERHGMKVPEPHLWLIETEVA